MAEAGDLGEPIGMMPDLMTGELACPDVKGEPVEPTEVLGGVEVCARD